MIPTYAKKTKFVKYWWQKLCYVKFIRRNPNEQFTGSLFYNVKMFLVLS